MSPSGRIALVAGFAFVVTAGGWLVWRGQQRDLKVTVEAREANPAGRSTVQTDVKSLAVTYRKLQSRQERTDLLWEWMQEDPIQCLEKLLALSGEPLRDVLIASAIEMWFERDPMGVMNYVNTRVTEDAELSPILLKPVVRLLAGESYDLIKVGSYLSTFPPSKVVYGAVTEVFAKRANIDPLGALEFSRQITNAEVRRSFDRIAGAAIASKMPAPIFDDGLLGDSGYSPGVVTGFISELLRKFPEETVRWLSAQPTNDLYDPARYYAIQADPSLDPQTAIGMAMAISDAALQEQAVDLALKRWALQDYAAAVAWAAGSHFPLEKLAAALSYAVPREEQIARIQSGIQQASALAEPRDRLRMEAMLFIQWASVDSQGASIWLANSDLNSETKQLLRERFLPGDPDS